MTKKFKQIYRATLCTLRQQLINMRVIQVTVVEMLDLTRYTNKSQY